MNAFWTDKCVNCGGRFTFLGDDSGCGPCETARATWLDAFCEGCDQ